MKKFFFSFLFALVLFPVFAEETPLMLQGRVKEAAFKTDLTNAIVLTLDSAGNVADTIPCNQGFSYRHFEVDTLSNFYLKVPRVDSTYVFDIRCEGYKSITFSFPVTNIGKRERFREIPTIYLERAPRMLKEVTVTSSKIKFYNKGDTVVYNADAFQLAEGSMLDALIAQLPGVELNDDGQIKVNGEFVESLLLNGKEFMDGNNNVMLENIAAYTVSNVQVYEGQTTQAKRMMDTTAPKVLTMDVRLKKEYNIGWTVNAQGGYGTDNRYIGRIFANWFNPTTRVSVIGNVNNLNDNRVPGKNDTWTPEKMPTGTKEYRMGGIVYSYETPEETTSAEGNLLFSQTVTNTQRTTSTTNFLPGGNTFENNFSDSRNRETELRTQHSGYHRIKNFNLGGRIAGSYRRTKNASSAIGGAFSQEHQGITREDLEALYSAGSPEMLASVINRSKTRTDGFTRTLSGTISPYMAFVRPRHNDSFSLYFTADYVSLKDEDWRDYDINYGSDATAAYRRRQYIDNTPNHNLLLGGGARYTTSFGSSYFTVSYDYEFRDKIKDSYMYALDRLNDMGVYGIVPEAYLDAFDPANSYTSRLITNKHSIEPAYFLNQPIGENRLQLRLQPEINIQHRKLDYWRNDRSYRLSKTNTTVNIGSIWDCMVEYHMAKAPDQYKFRNSLRYSYRISPTLPEMTDMLDIVDDSDPLNIYLGNPDLKTAIAHRHLVRWSYSPLSHTFQNILYLSYARTTNDLVRGYTYDTSTGVRLNRMYNVAGNRTAAVTNELNWQFGAKKQFTLSSETDFNLARYADMIGINLSTPELLKVDNRTISEKLRLGWEFAGQSLQLRGDYTNRHTTSSQAGFNDIDAWHLNYGISGVFKLPAGFGISTDFTCYTRHGYGSEYLDTTDPVWNMRVTYAPPRNSHWVFMADGFDLLHRLSNVNYAVTATGRTVSYTNTIPRYVLVSVQYRFSIQPKKK